MWWSITGRWKEGRKEGRKDNGNLDGIRRRGSWRRREVQAGGFSCIKRKFHVKRESKDGERRTIIRISEVVV